MDNEAALINFMGQINSGALSRNKHFEAFKNPLVKEAKQRQVRIDFLATIVSDPDRWHWALKPEPGNNDDWRLICRSKDLAARWTAKLRGFELELLFQHPQSGPHLKGYLAAHTQMD